MAIMYARSTLTSWDLSVSGGWSNTSGGASNGLVPSSTTDVIFDANSGSARTITVSDTGAVGSPAFKSLNTTGSAGMTFARPGTGAVAALAYGDVNLTSTVAFNVTLQCNASLNLNSGSAVIDTLQQSAGLVTLQSDLSVNTLTGTKDFNANNFNVTTGYFLSDTGTLTMGSGVWTLAGASWTTSSSTSVIRGTSTIKCITPGAIFTGNAKVYYNFWNSSGGAVTIASSNSFNNLRISAGSIQKFTAGTNTTVTSFTADGTGSPIAIDSTTTSPFTITSNAGLIYCDYISLSHCTASPANTWFARNSTNVTGNINWTFIPGNSKFLQFC